MLKTCVILVTDEPPSSEQLEGISGEGIEDLKTSLAASTFTQALVVVTGVDRNAEVDRLLAVRIDEVAMGGRRLLGVRLVGLVRRQCSSLCGHTG